MVPAIISATTMAVNKIDRSDSLTSILRSWEVKTESNLFISKLDYPNIGVFLRYFLTL